MLNSCKVRRNTRTREIDQVVIDRPFTDERANVIYNYYRSVGIPIHLGKEAMREELKKRGFNVDLEVAGWHGSPHNIQGGFRTDRIGTGEGNQAFGWGLYFTDLESIARHYANKLATPSETLRRLKAILWDKKEIVDLITIEQSSIKGLLEFKKAIFETTEVEIKGNSFLTIEERKYLEKESNNEKLSTEFRSQLQKYLYIDNIIADFYNALDSTRNLYRVTLHKGKDPSEYTWLEWDKPLTESQRQKIYELDEVKALIDRKQTVREGLAKKLADKGVDKKFTAAITGKDIYTGLSKELGSDKAASLFLLENGIDGIKYPAESISRGATSDNARGFNYVVFDENAITIEEQIQFLSTPSGEVYGFVTPEGEMFLDPEIAGVNTLVHEGAHIQYKVLKTAAERGDIKAQAVLTKIQEITNPVVETIFNAKKAQERVEDNVEIITDDIIYIVQEEGIKLSRWGNWNYFKNDPSNTDEESTIRDSVEDIDISKIISTETVSELRLEKKGEYIKPKYDEYSTGYPVAIRVKGSILLLDGHHRLELAKRAGESTIKVAIKDLQLGSDSMSSVDMQAEQIITKKMPELTELADKNIQLLKDYDRYQRILQKRAERRRVLKTDEKFLEENSYLEKEPIINLGTPSDILLSVGVTRPIEMTFSNLKSHIVGKEAHDITTLDLVNIMRGIHNPALVNKARDGKIQILTNQTNENGVPIVVILNNNYETRGGKKVANITTAYALTNSSKVVPTTAEDVLYVNKKRLANFLSDFNESKNRGFGITLFAYPEYDSSTDSILYTQERVNPEIEFDTANIRKIIENTKFIINKTNVNQVDFQIIGEQGAQRVQEYADSLSKAKELEQEGIPYDQIETQTGWYKYEGQWRTIPSEVLQNFKIQNYDKNTRLQLSEVLGTENVLFDLYPELKEITVVFVEENQPNTPQDLPQGFENSAGVFVEATQSIFIPTMVQGGVETSSRTDEETSRLLAHEVNHVVQSLEGFPVGGDEYSVIFEAGDIIGVDFSNKSFRFIIDSIDSTDTSKLTDNEKRILTAAKQSTRSFMGGVRDTTFRNYQHILGEIDSRIVEKALELHQQGQTIVNYSEALQLVEIQDNLDLNNIFLLRNGGVRFSLVEPQNLFVVHNISTQNLERSLAQGGLPAPSIAVANVDEGFTSFGEVSLVGSNRIIDPQLNPENRVFGSDIHSPTYPTVDYEITNTRALEQALESLPEELRRDFYNRIKNNIEYQNVGAEGLIENRYLRTAFALNKNKELVGYKNLGNLSQEEQEFIRPLVSQGVRGYSDIADNTEVVEKLQDLFEKRQTKTTGSLSVFFNGLSYYAQNEGKVDTSSTTTNAKEYIQAQNLEQEYRSFVQELYKNLQVQEQLFVDIDQQTGNRIYLEHTPENALQMMRSTSIRAGESSSTGMVGAFRALFTPEFSSIQDMQANRDSIVSEQEFEQTRQAIDDEFYSLQTELEPYKINPSSSILELMSKEASELYENGNSSGFNQLDPVLHDRFRNFVEILKTAPTEYFEAKPQRVVQIQEFSLALVPTGTSQALKDRLTQTGLEVQEYSSEQDRKQKAKQYTQRNNLAFEAAELSSPAYNQRENETDEQYKERLREEMFARALGDNAEQYLKDLGFTTQEAKTFLQKVQEFLAEIVDWLRGKKGLQDLSVDEINKLSIREFLDRSTTSMMLGEFKAPPQTAVQGAIQRNNEYQEELKFENEAQEYFTREADRLPLTLAVFNTKPFQDLQGKKVNPVTIQQLLNKTGIKQIEKDLINQILSDNYSGQKRIDYDEFEATVRANIMPLERLTTSSYADYGMGNLGDGNYGEAKTLILNSPIEHGVTGHFSGDFKASGRQNIKYVPKQLNDNTWVAVEEGYESQANDNNIYQFVGTAGTKEAVDAWIENYNIVPNRWGVYNDINDPFAETPIKTFSNYAEAVAFSETNGDYSVVDDRNRQKGYKDVMNSEINKGMFGHIRVWQDGQDFYVAELQSDFFQKNKAKDRLLADKPQYYSTEEFSKKREEFFTKQGFTPSRFREKSPDTQSLIELRNENIQKIEKYERLLDTVKNNTEFNEVMLIKKELEIKNEAIEDYVNGNINVFDFVKKYNNNPKEVDSFIKEEKLREEKYLLNVFTPQERQFIASQKIWEQRMVREAIKEASLSGATSLHFPTPYTLSVIEGYIAIEEEDKAKSALRNAIDGDIVDYLDSKYIVMYTDVPNGGTEVQIAPIIELAKISYDEFQDMLEEEGEPNTYVESSDGGFVYYTNSIYNITETIDTKNIKSDKDSFSIEKDLSDTQQTVARKYQEIAEILKSERGDNFEVITDENGFDWYKTKLTPEEVNTPVIAFQITGEQNAGLTPNRDVQVYITPATIRNFNEETLRLKELTNEYNNVAKEISQGNLENQEKFTILQHKILDAYQEHIKEKVSKIRGVNVIFNQPYLGSWEGNYEPSLNMTLSISPNADTGAISGLLFDIAENTSQDAFILEERSEIEDRTPLTEFDEAGMMHYPQIRVNFNSQLSVEEKSIIAQRLKNSGVEDFSIDGDYFIVSIIDFNSETNEQKEQHYTEKATAITSPFTGEGEKIGTNKVRDVQEHYRKSKYVGARNEGDEQSQTREYDRSDLFEEEIGASDNKSSQTQDFFSDVVTGASDRFKPTTPYQVEIQYTPEQQAFEQVYSKHRGNFDEHIATSIPRFRETQVQKGTAISAVISQIPDARVLDIGGSEGGFVKSITEVTGAQSINLEPNPDMAESHKSSPVTGSEVVQEAFYEGFGDVQAYRPTDKFDVVHESMVFQFITPNRDNFVKEVADNYLKEGGLFITEEKLKTGEQAYIENEIQKDTQHKSKYYGESQLKTKAEEILVGMDENQASFQEYLGILRENFDYVGVYWNSGNFYGIVATNSKERFNHFMQEVGDTTSEYTKYPIGEVTDAVQEQSPIGTQALDIAEQLLTTDIHGTQEYVPANSIITYYTETGEINYKQNPDGSITQLKTVSVTPQQEESIAYQQLLSIPNLSKEQALEAYKNLYSTEFYNWKNKTNEC